MLTNLALGSVETIDHQVHLVKDLTELGMVDIGTVFERTQVGDLTFQFHDNLGFQVRAAEDIHDVDEACEGGATVPGGFALPTVVNLGKQELQP